MNFPANIYWLSLVGAATVSGLSLPLWRRLCWRWGLVDEPGRRKIHTQPVALAGGLAVLSGLLVPVLIVALAGVQDMLGPEVAEKIDYGLRVRATQLGAVLGGALAMLGLGLLDDRFELHAGLKFGGQLLIALAVAAAGVRITLFVPNLLLNYALTILWLLTVINAFNFLDNMNGLCAGLGMIAALWLGLLAARHEHYLVAALAFLFAGALLGFLPWNFPRATAFLGDGGSHLIGYLMAVMAILPHFYSPKNPRVAAVFSPLFILAVPLADLVRVVWWRWRRRRPFYVGDTNHISHQLTRWGLSPGQAVVALWLFAAAAGSVAWWLN